MVRTNKKLNKFSTTYMVSEITLKEINTNHDLKLYSRNTGKFIDVVINRCPDGYLLSSDKKTCVFQQGKGFTPYDQRNPFDDYHKEKLEEYKSIFTDPNISIDRRIMAFFNYIMTMFFPIDPLI